MNVAKKGSFFIFLPSFLFRKNGLSLCPQIRRFVQCKVGSVHLDNGKLGNRKHRFLFATQSMYLPFLLSNGLQMQKLKKPFSNVSNHTPSDPVGYEKDKSD